MNENLQKAGERVDLGLRFYEMFLKCADTLTRSKHTHTHLCVCDWAAAAAL